MQAGALLVLRVKGAERLNADRPAAATRFQVLATHCQSGVRRCPVEVKGCAAQIAKGGLGLAMDAESEASVESEAMRELQQECLVVRLPCRAETVVAPLRVAGRPLVRS